MISPTHTYRFGTAFALSTILGLLVAPTAGRFANPCHAANRYGDLPLCFEANQGQFDSRVRFVSRGRAQTLMLTQSDAVLVLRHDGQDTPRSIVRMRLVGGNPTPIVSGMDRHAGATHYMIGKNPRAWRLGVPTYARVRYRAVYPGIDLIYYGNQGRLEYDFVVSPRIDPDQIRITFRGIDGMHLNHAGDLVLSTQGRELIQRRPIAFQHVDGRRRIVPSRYILHDGCEVSFRLGDYDRSLPLIIDPMIVYSTYLGGSFTDCATSVAVDLDGCAYVTGSTHSHADFPADSTELGGGTSADDVFVAKFNELGSELLYCTIIGGSAQDHASGIAVDYDGCAYIAGQTQSDDFPTVLATQETFGGGSLDAFVAKLSADGGSLIYSTYLGGGESGFGTDAAYDIAIDFDDNAIVVGTTNSHDFPLVRAIRAQQSGCGYDGFVARYSFNDEALTLDFCTYLGGDRDDKVNGVTCDAVDEIVVTGQTLSCDYPTTDGVFEPNFCGYGNTDAFVTKLTYDDETLTLGPSTYFGHLGDDVGNAVARDGEGNICIVGETDSWELPVYGSINEYGGLKDGFIAVFTPDLSYLRFGDYLGGSGNDAAQDVARDFDNNFHVVGRTLSSDMPVENAITETHPAIGPYDEGGVTRHLATFVAKYQPVGLPEYTTFLGGTWHTSGVGIATDYWGDAYVTGCTYAENFPTTLLAFQREHAGVGSERADYDAFLTKISPEDGTTVYEIVPFPNLVLIPDDDGDDDTGSSTCGAVSVPTMATMFLTLGGLLVGRRRDY